MAIVLMIPEPPPTIPVRSVRIAIMATAGVSTAGISATGVSTTGISRAAANAGVRILEDIPRAIAAECLCTSWGIGGIDDLDPILAVVGKNTIFDDDCVGASAFDIHAVNFVLVGGYIGQRDIVIGSNSDIESTGAIVVERAVCNIHCGLTVQDGAFCTIV